MTAPRDRLLGWIEGERKRQVALLQALTRIDTSNPPGDTRAAADLVTGFLAAEGMGCRTEAPRPEMPNLISTFAGRGAGRHLVLNGHLDVFPPGDRAAWSRDPFSGDLAGGRVHGRGTVDMNCGTTALLFAHAYLHRLRNELPGRVTLTVVSDEETGGRWGSGWLTARCGDEVLGDCVLNTEPSGLGTVRFGEKSMLWFRFTVEGPGGHSAYPHTGASANRLAAHLVRDLETIESKVPDEPSVVREALDRPEVRAAIEASLGAGAAEVMRRVSVNVGTVRGGVSINMLPAKCVLDVDFRLPVGISRDEVRGEVASIAGRHGGVRFEELDTGDIEANWSDPGHEMVGHLVRNARAGPRGVTPRPVVGLGGTDTRFWRARGVPAFVHGCSPAGMGAADESVSIEEFHHVLRTHALAAFDYLSA